MWNLKGKYPVDPDVSRIETEAALAKAAEITATLTGRPSQWLLVLFTLSYVSLITLAVWEQFWWWGGLFGVLVMLFVLFRRKIINPYCRVRPWRQLDQQGQPQSPDGFGPLFFMWVPVSIVMPSEPRWIGLLFGLLAGAHAYYGTRSFKASLCAPLLSTPSSSPQPAPDLRH